MPRITDSKKGFTLIEVIVVLVIIAILAAIIIPSMTGYIDEASHSALIAECRYSVTAAQTYATEGYATSGKGAAPDVDAVKKLAEVKGTVSAIEVDPSSAQVLHLTYTKNNVSVTYCAYPKSCGTHDETFNFTDGTSGGGSTGGGSTTSGAVTLTDSGGVSHILNPAGNWAAVKAAIINTGTNITSGTILSDSTGTYVIYDWNGWIHKQGDDSMSLASLSAANPGRFEKLTSSTKIWCANDIVDKNGNQWNSQPQKGDMCYYNGKYYVAPGDIGIWTLPPGGWIAVGQ